MTTITLLRPRSSFSYGWNDQRYIFLSVAEISLVTHPYHGKRPAILRAHVRRCFSICADFLARFVASDYFSRYLSDILTRSGSGVRSLCTPLYLHLSSLVFVSWTSKGEIGRVLNKVHRSSEDPERYICLPPGGQRFTNPGTWGWNYHSSDLPLSAAGVPFFSLLLLSSLFLFSEGTRGRDAYRLRVCGITQRPANVTYAAASWIFCNGV